MIFGFWWYHHLHKMAGYTYVGVTRYFLVCVCMKWEVITWIIKFGIIRWKELPSYANLEPVFLSTSVPAQSVSKFLTVFGTMFP